MAGAALSRKVRYRFRGRQVQHFRKKRGADFLAGAALSQGRYRFRGRRSTFAREKEKEKEKMEKKKRNKETERQGKKQKPRETLAKYYVAELILLRKLTLGGLTSEMAKATRLQP